MTVNGPKDHHDGAPFPDDSSSRLESQYVPTIQGGSAPRDFTSAQMAHPTFSESMAEFSSWKTLASTPPAEKARQ